jgi:TMEM175 potassium channel family protein
MDRGRLEAFSDGVIAILITIMVLELRAPQGSDWRALKPILPTLFLYVLSFIFVGIYWNNHHHMLQTVERVNGKILWANLHLLFWLSLVPFVTSWTGQNRFASLPTALYGVVFIMAAVAYIILQQCIIKLQGTDSKLAAAVGNDVKGKMSLMLYGVGIPIAYFGHPWVAATLYVFVALLWFAPDPRIETKLDAGKDARK